MRDTALQSVSSDPAGELVEVTKKIHSHNIALHALRARRRFLITSLAGQGMSEREIAKLAKISAPTVNAIKHREVK